MYKNEKDDNIITRLAKKSMTLKKRANSMQNESI